MKPLSPTTTRTTTAIRVQGTPLFLLAGLTVALSQAQEPTYNFHPVGEGLLAPSINVRDPVLGFGNKLVLSNIDKQGKQRLAVGNPNGYAHGLLNIYQYDKTSTKWKSIKTYLGRNNGSIGDFFDLSADGTSLAMRINEGDGSKSTVKVLNVDTGSQVGQELSCGFNVEGNQVSISPDGRTVAMSCEGFGAKRGKVRFFRLSHNKKHWRSAGFLEGVHSGDLFGWDTSLSASGTRVAISAPGYQGGVADTLIDRGFVAVYDYHWTTNEWMLKGSPLLGVHVRDHFGHALALSSDGRYLIASSPGPGVPGALSFLQTFVFMSNTAGWIRLGQVTTRAEFLNGEVAISGDGSRIAFRSSSPVTGSSSQQQATTTHRFRVLEKGTRYWTQQSPTLVWQSDQDDDRIGLAMRGNRFAYATTNQETGKELVRIMDYRLSTTDYSSFDNDNSAPAPQPTLEDEVVNSYSQSTIDVIDISTRFNDNQKGQEIQAIYEFHADQEVKFAVMDLDCKSFVDQSYIGTTTSRTTVHGINGKDRLEAILDINPTSIATSPMFRQIDPETAGLSLCLRVDILDEFKNLVASKTSRVFIELSTTDVFRMNNIDVESGASIDFELHVSLDYDVTACQCDENLTCNESALTPFDDVRICVRSDSSKVEVTGIQQLRFSQGSLSQTVIGNGNTVGQKTEVKQVGDQVVISSTLAAAFFQWSNPDDVAALGVCVVKFHAPTGSRYLSVPFGHRNMNMEQEDNEQEDDVRNESSGFGVGLHLLSSDESTATRTSSDGSVVSKFSLSFTFSALTSSCLLALGWFH